MSNPNKKDNESKKNESKTNETESNKKNEKRNTENAEPTSILKQTESKVKRDNEPDRSPRITIDTKKPPSPVSVNGSSAKPADPILKTTESKLRKEREERYSVKISDVKSNKSDDDEDDDSDYDTNVKKTELRSKSSKEIPIIIKQKDAYSGLRPDLQYPQPYPSVSSSSKSARDEIVLNSTKADGSRVTPGQIVEQQISIVPSKLSDPSPASSSKGNREEVMKYINLAMPSPPTGNMPTVEAFVYMIVPPDGGYGWIILLVAFVFQGSIDGLVYSIGRLLPDISNDLHLSTSGSALIAAVQMALYYIAGPFASALINKFGFRPIAILGVVIAALGTLVGSFCSEIISLAIFTGLFVGFGNGTALLATLLIVGYYFEKYRPIAMSVACSGTGIGMLIFSPFNDYLAKSYGWRNTFRIQVAIYISLIGVALALRPVQPTLVGRYNKPVEDDIIESYDSLVISSARYSKYLLADSHSRVVQQELPKSQSLPRPVATKPGLCRKIFCCLCFVDRPKKEDSTEVLFIKKMSHTKTPQNVPGPSGPAGHNQYLIVSDPLDRKDILYEGPVNYKEQDNVLEDENIEIFHPRDEQSRVINYTISVTRSVVVEQPARESNAVCYCHPKIQAAINLLFDFQILKVKEFQVFLASTIFFYIGSQIPILFLTKRAEIPENWSNFLLSAVGLTNFVVRLFAGFFIYFVHVDPIYVSGGVIIVCGFISLLSSFLWKDSVTFQYIFAVIFGVATALITCFRSLIIVNLLGLKKLTNAFGIISLLCGFASFLSTNLAALLIQATDSCDSSFLFSSIAILLSGITLVTIPEYSKYINRNVDEDAKKKVRFTK